MLDECTTPYFVQVDEDMLLYPHAVRTLHERMAAAATEVAMVDRAISTTRTSSAASSA